MQNATKIMLYSTDSTFFQGFCWEFQAFSQNSSIFPDLELSKWNSRNFPGFQGAWEPCKKSVFLKKIQGFSQNSSIFPDLELSKWNLSIFPGFQGVWEPCIKNSSHALVLVSDIKIICRPTGISYCPIPHSMDGKLETF